MLAGVALDILAWWVARYGPSGNSWSFRGNGALIVPIGLGAAVLAGSWTALVLHSRSVSRWRTLGIVAGAVGALLVAVSAAALIVFGSAGQRLSDSMTTIILLWTVLAPALALLWRQSGGPPRKPLMHALARSPRGCSNGRMLPGRGTCRLAGLIGSAPVPEQERAHAESAWWAKC